MNKVRGLILAGGFGKRMTQSYPNVPKVLLPIAGKPLLEHLICGLSTFGIKEIALSLHFKADQIKKYFGDGTRFGTKLTYFIEKSPRGSGGALYEARDFFDRTLVVLNGDVVSRIALPKLVSFHRSKGAAATLVVHITLHPFDSDMIERDQDDRVVRIFRPKPDDQFENVANAGMFVFEPTIKPYIAARGSQSMEQDLIPALIRATLPVYAYETQEYIKDIGTPARFQEVQKEFTLA